MITSGLVILGAATLVATVFFRVKLPPILAFLTAGVLVGPSGLALVDSRPQVGLLTEIVGMLLMFAIGLEFSFKELLRVKRHLLFLGLGQVVVSIFVFTFCFHYILDFPTAKAIFLSFLVTLSSTAVVMKLLHDNRDTETPYGRAGISTLLMQDICVIPMIIMIPFLVSQRSWSESILDSILPFLLLTGLVGVLLWLFSRYALPFLLDHVSRTKNREIFFFAILFILVGSAALMHKIGLSVSLGAFVAGMLLGGSPYSRQATAEILPLRDAFLSLFFVAIGMLLDLGFLMDNFHKIILFGTAVTIIKGAIIFFLVWFSGNAGSVARATTALLFQFGEFSFILSEIGLKSSIITEKDRQYFVAMGVISLAITPLLYSLIPRLIGTKRLDKIMPQNISSPAEKFRHFFLNHITQPVNLDEFKHEAPPEDHVLIIGYGIAGQSLARVLSQAQIPFCVVDLNSETVRKFSSEIPILFGDASKPDILLKAGIEKAKLVTVLTSGVNMIEPVLYNIRNLNPVAPVIVRANYIMDLTRLKRTKQMRFVVSELESALEVIKQTLEEFDLPQAKTQEVVLELRTAMRDVESPNG